MVAIAVIPARSGSKSIPGKNVLSLQGRPLLAYSIRAANCSKLIEQVYLSTDSEEYAEIGRSYGAEVPFIRPLEISGDNSTDYEWVSHFLEWYEAQEGSLPDCLVHLRPTTPLRDPDLIDEAIKLFLGNNAATALRSIQTMPQTAYKCFERQDGLLRTAFTRQSNLDQANLGRQAFPPTFNPNGYVDVLRPTFVLDNQSIHGDHVLAFETPGVPDIDTWDDIEFLKFQCQKNATLVEQLFPQGGENIE